MIERLIAIDVEHISVLVDANSSAVAPSLRHSPENVKVRVVADMAVAIAEQLADYARRGIGHSFINAANAYAETDLLDLFCFHREARQPVTRTFDRDGSLDLWVVDCAKAQPSQLVILKEDVDQNGAPRYFIREYVNRLLHPRDVRRLAADILRRNCETGASGKQVRPGVWIDDGGEVHRRARIVAPAYVGRASKVKADALITRFTDVERNCCVDSGTVIEDSSILANTTIGICLDLCHSIASGTKLWNLERDVAVEIVDPKVMRFTSVPRKWTAHRSDRIHATEEAAVLQKPEMPQRWQIENNNIQE
jgi:carbonic anhydrase/acetyltransferase-like protein (isoleucine patch superfamily)